MDQNRTLIILKFLNSEVLAFLPHAAGVFSYGLTIGHNVLLYVITVCGYSLKMGISWLYVYYVVFGYVPTMGLSQFI